MEKDQVISMFEQIMSKLDEHSQKLDSHSEKLDAHGTRLEEHGQLLSTLRTGQEHLKDDIDGMKTSNTKEFGALHERMDLMTDSIELLRDESWD